MHESKFDEIYLQNTLETLTHNHLHPLRTPFSEFSRFLSKSDNAEEVCE